MLSAFQFLNRRLNIKLNLMLVVSFGLMLLVLALVINLNFPVFIRQWGQKHLEDDATIVEQQMAQIETQLLNAARLLLAVPDMLQIFDNGETPARTAMLLQANSLGLDKLLAVNQSGDRLLTIASAQAAFDQADEDRLAGLGLIGAATTGLVKADGADRLFLTAVMPVKNTAGAIIGTLLVSREINDGLLDTLDFARSDTHLGFVYQQRLIARDRSKPEELDEMDTQTPFIEQAQAGQLVIDTEPTRDADDTPDVVAYVPARIGGTIQGVFVIRYELLTMVTFQTQLVTSARAIVLLLALLALSTAIFVIRHSVIRPLEQLRLASQKLAAGDFSQRVTLASQDEIGQLGQSFNTMADQLERMMNQLQERMVETLTAREEAERANQVKSAFLASMSHELRTPLNSIINFSKFVLKGTMGPINDRQEEALTKVVSSSRHLLQLINDVLDMSKIESGSLTLFVEPDINVNDLLKTVVEMADSLLTDKPVALQLEIDDPLPLITGDRKRLLQIMLNVVSNACKFTQEGHIKITAQQQDDNLRLMVEDTGPGIAPADYNLVFEAFKQTTSGLRQGGGTGLGMPISRRLTEAHGGKLWFDSTPGQGTTFYVLVPLHSDTLQPVTIQ